MKSVRVRMYRQGLGDCFLLSFPRAGGESHLLIDCGVLKGTADATARMNRVAESILETTGGRVDALIVTHQHWDHVSGFLQAEAVFARLEVGEVWLAWTEDPADDLALLLAKRRNQALAAVHETLRHFAGRSEAEARWAVQRLSGLLEFQGDSGALAPMSTERAMDWAKNRERARVRYFKPAIEPVSVPGVEGARVYVLGPPRDVRMLRKDDPKAGTSEGYELAGVAGADLGFLAAVAALGGKGAALSQPFEEWFRITEADAWADEFFGDHYGFEGDDDIGWRRIESDWLGVTGRLALQLDSHTNNTSLALAFELAPSRRVLLFPGDAQMGSWLSWAKHEWQVKDGLDTRQVTTADLLARTVLYKVAHHGSHNGTPRDSGLELMSSRELSAMLPVDRATAKKMEWQMPFPSLYRRLQEKTNGRILDLETGLPDGPPNGAAGREWEAFIAQTSVHPDWLDYHVEL